MKFKIFTIFIALIFFIAQPVSISKADEAKNRLGGTISASLLALQQGIKIHRVHDVLEINQSIKVFEKILNQ